VLLIALVVCAGCASTNETQPASQQPPLATPSGPAASSAGLNSATAEPTPDTTEPSVDPAFCAAAADYVIAIDQIATLRRSGQPAAWVPAFKQLSAAGRDLGANLPAEVPAEVESALTTQTASLAGFVAEGAAQPSPGAEQLRDFDAASAVVADYLTAQCPEVQPPAN
jgi:hypothetical protein